MSRELDITLAKEFGYEVRYDHEEDEYIVYRDGKAIQNLPYYSTENEDMLELDKEMQLKGYYLELDYIAQFDFLMTGNDENCKGPMARYRKPEMTHEWVFARTERAEPLVRSLAAYLALTGRIWEE